MKFISCFFKTGIEDNAMLSAEWEASSINELDISSTELTENCLLHIFARMPKLNYLAVPNCDGFTDHVDIQTYISAFSHSYFFYSRFLINLLIKVNYQIYVLLISVIPLI